MSEFSSRFKFLRVNLLEMGRLEFSQSFNIPEITIRSWETNKSKPSNTSISKLINALSNHNINVSREWLEYGTGIPPIGINHNKSVMDYYSFEAFFSQKENVTIIELDHDFYMPFLPKKSILGGSLISNFSDLSHNTLVIHKDKVGVISVKKLLDIDFNHKILLSLEDNRGVVFLQNDKEFLYKVVWIKYPD